MKLHICAVGRLKSGAEKQLVDDYLARIDSLGRSVGLGGINLIEVEEKKRLAGPQLRTHEGKRLLGAAPPGAYIAALDEHGTADTTRVFADRLARWRDSGIGDLAFLIGGADGLAPQIVAKADHRLALGPMTWPHMLTRVMLTEQLYRVITVLAGHPYHRP